MEIISCYVRGLEKQATKKLNDPALIVAKLRSPFWKEVIEVSGLLLFIILRDQLKANANKR